MTLAGAQVIFKDNGSGYLIDKRFVAPGFPAETSGNHRLMGKHRGEALVKIFYRHIRKGFPPPADKLPHALHILAGLTIRLSRLTDDDALHRLTGHIGLKPLEELMRSNSHQPAGNNLQRVGDGYASTLLSVVDRQYARQLESY